MEIPHRPRPSPQLGVCLRYYRCLYSSIHAECMRKVSFSQTRPLLRLFGSEDCRLMSTVRNSFSIGEHYGDSGRLLVDWLVGILYGNPVSAAYSRDSSS